MRLMKISIAILITIVLSHVAQFADAAPAPTWTPGTPCLAGCTVEIFDHDGMRRDGPTSAIFTVRRPKTPHGPAPFLDLYNPTFSTIENCARMVRSIKKPNPGSVQLKAREYTLSGSDRVVFLVDKCRKLSGPGPGPGSSACASGDTPPSTSCSETGPGGWQTVTNTLSENSCQLGYTDAVAGPGRRVIYDNSYSVTCNGSSHEPSVFVGTTMSDSNWGHFNDSSETCRLQTGVRPSDGTRVVQKILCPSTPR